MMPAGDEQRASTFGLLVASLSGLLAVIICLLLFRAMVGAQATRAGTLSRMQPFLQWALPIICLGAGLIVGANNRRSGALQAPAIGVFLTSFAWFIGRRQELIASHTGILGYVLTTGALLAVAGAMAAPLLKERATTAVIALPLLGAGAFAYLLTSLSAVSGEVQREVIQPAGGVTTARWTVQVPGARVALLNPDSGAELYTTVSNGRGRYLIRKVPIGTYTLRAWDDLLPGSVVDTRVTVQRSLAGGTPWQTIALASKVRGSR
jgi:hypothetical protein